jgi:hypothetical protein
MARFLALVQAGGTTRATERTAKGSSKILAEYGACAASVHPPTHAPCTGANMSVPKNANAIRPVATLFDPGRRSRCSCFQVWVVHSCESAATLAKKKGAPVARRPLAGWQLGPTPRKRTRPEARDDALAVQSDTDFKRNARRSPATGRLASNGLYYGTMRAATVLCIGQLRGLLECTSSSFQPTNLIESGTRNSGAFLLSGGTKQQS